MMCFNMRYILPYNRVINALIEHLDNPHCASIDELTDALDDAGADDDLVSFEDMANLGILTLTNAKQEECCYMVLYDDEYNVIRKDSIPVSQKQEMYTRFKNGSLNYAPDEYGNWVSVAKVSMEELNGLHLWGDFSSRYAINLKAYHQLIENSLDFDRLKEWQHKKARLQREIEELDESISLFHYLQSCRDTLV